MSLTIIFIRAKAMAMATVSLFVSVMMNINFETLNTLRTLIDQ